MGSATYEWMVRNAEAVAAETGSAWPYTQPAWIFSSRKLPLLEGADIRFFDGDMKRAHAEMRVAAGTKNIWIVGGGDLAGQFYDAGLLDELVIQVGSATLGKGKPLSLAECSVQFCAWCRYRTGAQAWPSCAMKYEKAI